MDINRGNEEKIELDKFKLNSIIHVLTEKNK